MPFILPAIIVAPIIRAPLLPAPTSASASPLLSSWERLSERRVLFLRSQAQRIVLHGYNTVGGFDGYLRHIYRIIFRGFFYLRFVPRDDYFFNAVFFDCKRTAFQNFDRGVVSAPIPSTTIFITVFLRFF